MLKQPGTWFLLLAAAVFLGPYVLGIRPRTRRERRAVAVTLAFLAWILLLTSPVRSS